MELEVGMYLRHSGLEGEYPIIQKITELKTPGRCGGKYKVYTDRCGDWFIDSDYIELDKSKYSHNIIDLIEVGDYVNGMEVVQVGDRYFHMNSMGLNDDFEEVHFKIPKQPECIVSIVTKEQFESLEYKL